MPHCFVFWSVRFLNSVLVSPKKLTRDTLSQPECSVVVPVRDEEDCVGAMVKSVASFLMKEGVSIEIIAVLDGCNDSSEQVLNAISELDGVLKILKTSETNRGFGSAVNLGISSSSGDVVVIMMADGSDSPQDALRYYRKILEGYDCVFGTRFSYGGIHQGYPIFKLILNRLANFFIRTVFGYRLDDTTNAFKAYKREVLESISPIISRHFNITVELPVKAILRGYSYAAIPVSWRNRKTGKSKLKLREMGSKYFATCVYLWVENYLSPRNIDKSKVI